MADLILASASPRRKQLLEQAGYTFDIIVADVDETNPPGMDRHEVPGFLARKKAAVVAEQYPDKTVIAADTVVLLDQDILGKPVDEADALRMLGRLSGRMHEVITGVCIRKGSEENNFSVITEVYFRELSEEQIRYYIQHYKPFDKAGAYAIQEWIGLVGIDKINGDYYNVMGLPVSLVSNKILEF